MSSCIIHPAFDGHEQLAFHRDDDSGLRAVVAVHNTRLGPSLGGCRVYPYDSLSSALGDVLRLAKGMTYKAAMAGLAQGGGKSVIIADPHTQKTPQMMRAMGRFVDTLGGRYIIAEDSGTNAQDMQQVATQTAHIRGVSSASSQADPDYRDTSAATAWGVFLGMREAVRQRLGRDDLDGSRVAIQGLGKVGAVLAAHLHEAGARLWVCDAFAPALEYCAERFGAVAVDPEEIFSQDVDVFSPCALGGVLNPQRISALKASVVAGAANNQLATPDCAELLQQKNIAYAPDYVINAGGIINISYEGPAYRWATVDQHLRRIPESLTQIFQRSASQGHTTAAVADRMAQAIFRA
ncbi:MAG: Glu/Leu/Phe/Val family dehydrogenase [Panacagrimonas sp.]